MGAYIFHLVGRDIEKLTNGLNNIEDITFVLQSSVEKENLGKNIADIKHSNLNRLNKIW